MAHDSAFVAPFSGGAWNGCRKRVLSKRRVPVCVLNEPRTERAPRGPKAVKSKPAVVLPDGVAPVNYRVLPEDLPEDQHPPPPPTHYTVPVFGYLIDLVRGGGAQRRKIARRFNGVFTSAGFLTRMHFITDINAVNALNREVSVFVNRDASPIIKEMFGENSMLLLDGADHQVLRNQLGPAFSPKLFPFYFDRIRQRVENAWADMARKTAAGKSGIIDDMIRELFLAVTIDMVNNISMESEYYSTVREKIMLFQTAFFSPPGSPFMKRALEARDVLLEIVEELVRRALIEDADIIGKIREYGDKMSVKGSKDISKGNVCIMHVTLANTNLATGENAVNDPDVIRFQALLLVGMWFAGMTTSSSTTSCALFEMGCDDSIWRQLVAEQDEIVEAAGGDRTLVYEQLSSMPLLDSYMSEILRIHPAARGVMRRVAKDCEVFGHKLEKDSRVFFDFVAAMQDERYYEEPEKLKVDRFLRKEDVQPPPRVLTFGSPSSPHYCIGAILASVMMKTAFSVLLRNYTMELDPKQSRKFKRVPDDTPASKGIVSALKPRS